MLRKSIQVFSSSPCSVPSFASDMYFRCESEKLLKMSFSYSFNVKHFSLYRHTLKYFKYVQIGKSESDTITLVDQCQRYTPPLLYFPFLTLRPVIFILMVYNFSSPHYPFFHTLTYIFIDCSFNRSVDCTFSFFLYILAFNSPLLLLKLIPINLYPFSSLSSNTIFSLTLVP